MILGHLALLAAAMFTGAALYINAVEQPARLSLPARAACAAWKPARGRGLVMLAGLSLAGFVLGLAAFGQSGNWQWLAGGVLLLAAWPYTFIALMPTDRRLRAARDDARGEGEDGGEDTLRLLANWGQLHMVRTGLGAVASFVFLCAALS